MGGVRRHARRRRDELGHSVVCCRFLSGDKAKLLATGCSAELSIGEMILGLGEKIEDACNKLNSEILAYVHEGSLF